MRKITFHLPSYKPVTKHDISSLNKKLTLTLTIFKKRTQHIYCYVLISQNKYWLH